MEVKCSVYSLLLSMLKDDFCLGVRSCGDGGWSWFWGVKNEDYMYTCLDAISDMLFPTAVFPWHQEMFEEFRN